MPNRVLDALAVLLGRKAASAAVVVGETSALRAMGYGMGGRFWPSPGLQLDTSRVNYQLARELYNNELPQYKLGGGFAKPIVNAKSGFIGRPSWDHPDADVQSGLEHMSRTLAAQLYLLIRNSLRDGDAFARLDIITDPLRDLERVALRLPPPEFVDPEPDPVTGELLAVTINHPVYLPEETTGVRRTRTRMRDSSQLPAFTVVEHITRDRRTVKVEEQTGHAPQEVVDRYDNIDEDNRWGFVPIIHFRNEPDDHALFGKSELESVEPILQAYHEVMLHAVQGTRLFSWPKIKFQVRDPDQFLDDNAPGWRRGGAINWQDKEILILRTGTKDIPSDDAAFLQASAGTSDVSALLELLYACVIETSEVPEFVFGAAIASSKASVSEQLLPFEKTIDRKRLMLNDPFNDLGTMWALMARTTGEMADADGASPTVKDIVDGELDVEWPEMAPKDEQALAQTVSNLVRAFVEGVQAGIIGAESAAEFLRPFVTTMEPWSDPSADDDEMRRITEGLRFIEQAQSGGPPPAQGGARSTTGNGTTPVPSVPLVDYTSLLTRINGR